MKFLDANVFIYAYYKPKRQLNQTEKRMKEQAKSIISDISQGKEEVLITVIHLSEIVNILKHSIPLEQLTRTIRGLFMLDNVKIMGVSKEEYLAATETADELKLEANDALAIDFMKANNINEIYSFDEDFDRVPEVTRLPKP